MEVQNTITIETELEETLKLANLIKKEVQSIGKKNAIDKVVKKFHVQKCKTDYERLDIRKRVGCYLDSLDEIHLTTKYAYGNDIARALAISLKLIKTKELSKHNMLSYNKDIRQYDPNKNGINILKHGLSFDEVLSYSNGNFARLAVAVFENGDQRYAVFSKVPNENKYIVSIVKYHGSETNHNEETITEITEQVLKKKIGNEKPSVEVELTQDDLIEIMKLSAEKNLNFEENEPMTFISSWYFDLKNFDETVTDRIRFSGSHDVRDPQVAAKEMKARALVILKEAWDIEIK